MAKTSKPKKIRDPQFAKRITQAADDNPQVPPYNRGRLTWLRDNLAQKFRVKTSTETVRKWFSGEARPRPDKMKLIAIALECDLSWLSLGIAPEMEPRARDKRSVALSGAANVLAGMVQMDGGVIAFPQEDDSRADCVHFFAIIKGAQYGLHASLAKQDGANFKFSVPTNHDLCTVVGVVKHDGPACDFFEIPATAIEKSKARHGGFNEVTVIRKGGVYWLGAERLSKIKTFATRF